jgi:hypothetical protein
MDGSEAGSPQPLTMDALQRMTGAHEDEEDENMSEDNVSDDDEFPENGRSRMYSDPGYPTYGDWAREMSRHAAKKAMGPNAGPNPSEIAFEQLHGKVLHPEFAARYTVTEELGSGGFGFVCVAVDMIEGKEVAVKFINKTRAPGSSTLAMANEEPLECFVLRCINHPNVVKYIEQFEDEEFYYLVSLATLFAKWLLTNRCKSYMVIHGIEPGCAEVEKMITPKRNTLKYILLRVLISTTRPRAARLLVPLA